MFTPTQPPSSALTHSPETPTRVPEESVSHPEEELIEHLAAIKDGLISDARMRRHQNLARMEAAAASRSELERDRQIEENEEQILRLRRERGALERDIQDLRSKIRTLKAEPNLLDSSDITVLLQPAV